MKHHNFSLCQQMAHLRPAPSGLAANQSKLKKEAAICFIRPENCIRSMFWLRESFLESPGTKPEKIRGIVAYSIDAKGAMIRHWYIRPTDYKDYDELGTCPREAIYPMSIDIGKPSLPALPYCTPLEP